MGCTRFPKHTFNYNPRGRRDGGLLRKKYNASMPEKVKRPNPWRKMMMVMDG
jgi:hypothetical protein